jgi:CRISPR-associated protein Cmr1
VDGFGIKHLRALFEIVCLLGGLGKRSRRGRGAIKIKAMKEGDKEFTPVTADVTLETILEKLKLFSPHFKVNNGDILYDSMGRTEVYPTIQRIQIGGYDPNILAKIDLATHKLLDSHEERYEATMGHASRGRFASPMYTSVIVDQKGGLRPIITLLKTIPDAARRDKIQVSIQDEYKNKIL